MDVRVGLWRKLSTEELMLLNCGVGDDTWESLGLHGDPTSPFWRRSVLGVLWKNDTKAETPVLLPPHVKSWLIGKDSDAGRDWEQKEKGMTEDEMAGWRHWLDGRESEWTPGVGDRQGGLACCDSWGHKESKITEWLNWTEMYSTFVDTTWTKYAKILKCGGYFNVSQGSILLFLWEFADSLHNLMIQNLGLGKHRTIVVTWGQHNLGVTWC